MKKVLSLLFLMLFSLALVSALDCPIGLENDSYPGACNLYTDSNGDNLCDLSQEQVNQVISGYVSPTNYYLWQISLISLILYLLSYGLVKEQVYSIVFHKKLWNMLLLVSFIVTALTSILFLLEISYGISITSLNLTFWHIEIGLVMILISIFHTLWHIPYLKSYFKN